MSFIDTFKEFKTQFWKRPEEISLIKSINSLEIDNLDDLNSFINNNKNIILYTSDKFKDYINNKLQNDLMESKQGKMTIKIGYDNWIVERNKNRFSANKNGYGIISEAFVRDNGTIFWDKPHLVPFVVKECVEDMVIKQRLQEDVTTADLTVYDSPLLQPNKIKAKDVYKGKDEDEVEVTFDTFQDSVKEILLDDVEVISEGFNTKKKNIELILESRGKKHRVLIPKKSMVSFIKENCEIKSYINLGKFDYERFIESKSLGFKKIILKEFIDNEISGVVSEEMEIISVKKSEIENTVEITYMFNGVEEVEMVDETEFFMYCLQNDDKAIEYVTKVEVDGEEISLFDEDNYLNFEDVFSIAKEFINK